MNKEMIELCEHCGNKGKQEIVYNDTENFFDKDTHFNEYVYEYVLKCPVCKKITILERYTYDGYCDEDGTQFYDDKRIYPLDLNLSYVPKKIADKFSEAVKLKNYNIEASCATFRKVLEMICNDKGGDMVKRKRLNTKVDILIKENIFPMNMQNAMDLIRTSGNNAVHDNDVEISLFQLNLISDLIYSIIEYLYIIPSKMDNLHNKI